MVRSLAAQHGHPVAQSMLGTFYAEGGAGLPKDEKRAIELFRQSANQGDSFGQYLLGTSYLNAEPPNYQAAFKWLSKSAGQGVADAQGLTWGLMFTLKAMESKEMMKRQSRYFKRREIKGTLTHKHCLELTMPKVLEFRRIQPSRGNGLKWQQIKIIRMRNRSSIRWKRIRN